MKLDCFINEINSMKANFPVYLPYTDKVEIFGPDELKKAVKVLELAYNRSSIEVIEDMIEFISFNGENIIILTEFQKCYNSENDWNKVLNLMNIFFCQCSAAEHIKFELDFEIKSFDYNFFLDIWKKSLTLLYNEGEDENRHLLIDKYNSIFQNLKYFGGLC